MGKWKTELRSVLRFSVLREQLSIEGEVRSEEPAKEVVFHRRERSSGKFYRGFKLPYEIDGDKVKATYKDGVLRLNLPRAEVSKPRKINVSAG